MAKGKADILMNILYWKEHELRQIYTKSSAWHARNRNPPLPDWESTEPRLVLPRDAFALAALHRRLVNAHRLADAVLVLDKLRELATRPCLDADTMRHPVAKTQSTSIPIVC